MFVLQISFVPDGWVSANQMQIMDNLLIVFVSNNKWFDHL